MKYRRLLSIPFLFITLLAQAQQKYWIFFKDKEVSGYDYHQHLSPQTLENRERQGLPLYQYTDVPVTPAYLGALQNMEIRTVFASRWLNGVSAYMNSAQLAQVRQLPYVKEVVAMEGALIACGTIGNSPKYIHIAMQQMEMAEFANRGYTGKGIVVGVIDAGFYNAEEDKYLKHLFEDQRVLAQRDFLDPTRKNIITQKATDSDYHGRMVLDMITGYNKNTGEQRGMAIDARFCLARTEHGDKEFRGEEDTWIAAMEWMDSLGVRLINTSLGYAIKMDDPNDNYKQEEMNGKTARISKAAQIATGEKGIFLAVSAGNEGSNTDWKIISAPADAEGVLSVGATNRETWDKIDYSSLGPEFLNYLKPNVSCYSPNGTSFSSPALAGFVACLMQAAPNKTNKELKSIIEKSGHLYPYGNNYLGYGVPRASKVLELLGMNTTALPQPREIHVKSSQYALKLSQPLVLDVIVFHKKDEKNVLMQDKVKMKAKKSKKKSDEPSFGAKYVIKKMAEARRTTVHYGENVLEIFWE